MRIGIILHPYDEDKPAGLARTIFELTKGMLETDKENEYIIYLKKQPRAVLELPDSFRVEILGGGRFWLENLKRAPKADVYIFNTPMMPLFWRPSRSVVLALDFAYWHLAHHTARAQISKWVTFFLHAYALKRTDLIISISEATKKDILALFKIEESKIKVVYCGFKKVCDVPEKKKELPQKFFFFAGIIKKRKNVLNIVRAFHLFSRKNPGYSLVVGGGGSGEYYEAVQKYIRENNLSKEVFFVGHLNDGELSYIYKRAEGLVFPTLIEGFGYPVLEAMQCGIPVITSNQSSLCEVGGNGSALLVNPYEPQDIARAMERIAREQGLRETLKERGFAQAARFSWQKAARELLQEIGADDERARRKRKVIFLTITRGLLIRNFFHSGAVDNLLERGFRVVILVPHYWNIGDLSGLARTNLIFEHMPPPQKTRFKRIFEEFSKGVVFNQTVHVRYRYRFAGEEPIRALYFVRMLFFAPLRFITVFKPFLRFLEYRLYPERQSDYLFEKHQPALVFNTAAGQSFSLLKAARRHRVPSIDMPKSWDNASKLLFRVKADYIFAWGPFMAEQIVNYQGYHPREVVLTGVPQFDYYFEKKGLLSREEFLKKFKFDPAKKLILYVSTGGDCCDEADYLFLLKKYLEIGILKDVQVLIRPHLKYAGDKERFRSFEKYPNFAVDATDVQNESLRDNWDISERHTMNLRNSLVHAAVCINIGSTIMLDAAACGTPSININFDIQKNISPHRSTKRLFLSDYIQAAVETGGTRVVESENEFRSALTEILAHGKDDVVFEEGRRRLLRHIAYKNDGRSSERIVRAIEDVIEKKVV